MTEPKQISSFRKLMDVQLNEFIIASFQFGEPLTAMADMVKKAFENQLSFIIHGVTVPRPDDSTYKSMMKPLAATISEIQAYRDRNRHVEEFFNHMSTVSESVVALSWIGVSSMPVPFVRDMRDAGEYFGNRVLSTNKGNQRHLTWINKWNEVLKGLEQYVKEFHLTGFHWGAALGMAAAGCGGGDPGVMPPPPPPPPIMDNISGADNRQTLLKELNQGVDIVRMLKPVSREQTQSQQAASCTGDGQPKKSPSERTYPPKFALDGRKWRVEHQKARYDLVIDNAEMSHSLAMFMCQNAGLEVKNKINGVSIDNCKRCSIVLSDIISAVELIRCQHIKLQCSGHVPLISLDNCDSIEVYLTDKSVDAEFISSKSTSLNISVLKPDGDYTEMAVPEQIKTVVVGGKLKSTVVEKI